MEMHLNAPTAVTDPATLRGEIHRSAQRLVLVGFLTMAAQGVLVRELFSALYGSDVAIAFALASWTFLSGLGACMTARLPECAQRLRRGLPLLYTCTVSSAFLWIRHWGSSDVVTFTDYARIPLFLLLPCLLGGGLFPLFAAEGRGNRTQLALAQAYALETVGGLAAGILLAVLFVAGASSLPVLLCLFLPAAAILLPSGRANRICLAAAGLALISVPFSSAGRDLEALSLRLRYPHARIVDHRNTPYALLTATSRNGQTTVFENGLPVADNTETLDKTMALALALSFPPSWNRVCIINGHAAGFAAVLARLEQAPLTYRETDPYLHRFVRRWQPSTPGPTGTVTVAAPRREALRSPPWDAILICAAPPGTLLGNRLLSREMFADVAARLSDSGCLVVMVPAAPGFMHPLQRRYLASIVCALERALPWVKEIPTELGVRLLVGSHQPVAFHGLTDLDQRLPGLDPTIQAAVCRLAAWSENPLLPDDIPPTAAECNSVRLPAAYFAYLHFRGAMLEEAGTAWTRLLRRRPLVWSIGMVGLLLLTGCAADRWVGGVNGVFWSSWMSTMATMISVYLYQSIVGQAYWVVSLLVAISMCGIAIGASCHASRRTVRLSALCFCFMAGLFPCYGLLSRLPEAMLLALLLGGNAAIGVALGWRMGRVTAGETHGRRQAGFWFAVDLLGATAGLFLGSVLLCWWSGFQHAALVCTAGATVACLGSNSR